MTNTRRARRPRPHDGRVFYLALLLSLVTALTGCGLNPFQQPTPAPIIIVATDSAAGTTAVAVPATVAPTTAGAGAAPSSAAQVPTTPAAAATAAPASKGSITFAFDAFPSYFPGIIAEVKELLARRGYELKLVPFALDGQNDFAEEERFARLQSGEWDVLATTLDGFARRADPAIGAITTIIDESAGADKLVARPEIATLNDLRGKRIAFSQGSVSEFFLYYALNLAGLGPNDVTLLPSPTVDAAVEAYRSGQADALSAWEPNVLSAEEQGAKVLIASDKLRAILDVLVSSRNAIETKTEATQAFHDAWYAALKLMTDSPEEAEKALIDWGHNEWSGIAAPGDLSTALAKLAQANLGANQLAFRSPDLLVSRLAEAQTIWRNANQSPPSVDLAPLVDGRFVASAAQQPALAASRPPVNSSFLLTAQVDLPQLSEQEQQAAQEIVKLPLEKIDFEPDSQRLSQQAIQALSEQVLPVLRSSWLYLKIDGNSAWPGPEGRFSAEEIRSFALSRANSVATFLVQQGINPNRLLIGTLEPQFPNSLDEAQLAQDRIVRFTLVTPQGR